MIGCEVTLEDFDVSKDRGLLAQCHSLRREVFGEEYGSEELVRVDDEDRNSWHIVARWIGDGSVIATCRLRSVHPYVKLEQVAVRKGKYSFYDWRRRTIGHRLCRRAIELAGCLCSRQVLVTYSQLHVVKFYEQLGFVVASDEFMDAGILHKVLLLDTYN
ncbi:unnamed protein product [Litomosoides sigmodontis]|uniref:N-acetyltransferase domain-containing protein n=1 Tax=Litomosoides sigmodontis TaxID=42156 RepID=A0A3P6TDH3_LITSI|nr:unnamed protein product [Litomosoides sigmodontis]